MKDKIFKLCYNIDYTAASKYPNNLVILGSGGGAPASPASPASPPDRMLFSYRREIKDKKGGKIIGDASYVLHAYKLEVSDDKKNGKIFGTFTAHHELQKCGNEWDITYSGNATWVLGEKSGGLINPSNLFLNIVDFTLDNISANSIFKNDKKINHGNNQVNLNDGKYKIKGIYDMYDFC
jgi:hypothetical protein